MEKKCNSSHLPEGPAQIKGVIDLQKSSTTSASCRSGNVTFRLGYEQKEDL